jgi:predicted nuclease of predicted toxin-antitoxin system
MMKFLADMGISPKTVAFLKELGYEAVHAHSIGIDKWTDKDILEKAHKENHIVLTHDLDFGELMAAYREQLPSVVIFRLRNMHPDQVNLNLKVIIAQHQNALKEGALISVTEGQIRVRLLPIN